MVDFLGLGGVGGGGRRLCGTGIFPKMDFCGGFDHGDFDGFFHCQVLGGEVLDLAVAALGDVLQQRRGGLGPAAVWIEAGRSG